ncbi:MAG TPA: glycosyltransferase family 39 protein [Verrucomicrobiae bacterium]|jgi:4-amino-4-deoxy-L-arabinose transferase-like glycosyltransferase
MDNQPAANQPSAKPLSRLWPWLIVILVLLFIGFIRFRLLDMPLERDEGEYAYAGQLILQGIPPYELAYNMKLPGTYYAYAAGMAVFGQTVQGIHLTLIAINSLTIIFVFLLGRKLCGTVAGLAACASYGLMSVDPLVYGTAAHATHFVVLFAVPATLVLLVAQEKKTKAFLFISGLLYGLAFIMKQQGLFFILFGGLFLFWQGVRDGSILTKSFYTRGLAFAGGVFLPFAMVCLVCLVAGDFHRFWFWTFTYAKWYATALPYTDGVQMLIGHVQQTFYFSCGFWALAAIGLFLAAFNKQFRGPAIFLMVLWLFSFCATSTGYYYRNHYFILLLPAFALMVGMAVAAMQEVLRFRVLQDVFRSLPVILFGLIFGWAVTYQSQYFFELSPRQALLSLYQLNPFEESQVVGNWLRDNAAPDAKVVVIGSEPEIYFYARRHSATGYIYTYALMEPQPAALAWQHDMISEIESNHPEYLVFVASGLSWLMNPHSNHLIMDWAGQYAVSNYDRIGVVRNVSGKIVSVWGDDAKKADAKGDCLLVYRLKPGADKN